MTRLKRFSFLIFLLAIVVISSCKSTERPSKTRNGISEVTTYEFDFLESESIYPILDKAAAENKLIFVDMYTTWCLPCKMMDEDVFSHKGTADFINEYFISYRVNAEKMNGPDLMMLYNAKSYPTLLFIDPKGKELSKKSGTTYHTEFKALAQEAIDQHRANSIN